MKTAITVLQEMMIKLGRIPEYECIAQSGPRHQVTFEFKCVAEGISVTAQARSKKEAKQESARRMLLHLRARGYTVPPPFDTPRGEELDDISPPSPIKKPALEVGPSASAGAAASAVTDARSYVALLKELCEQYKLGAVEYTLTGDTGPAHLRRFVMRARLGGHEREAAAGTKKAARQLAAEQLYTYLRENLKTTTDFCEEDALKRALEKAMERYEETQESQQWRPDLSQKIAEFHLGLLNYTDEDKRARALQALAGGGSEEDRLVRALDALALRGEESSLDGGVALLSLAPANPPLVFAGRTPPAAARAALRYLARALAADPAPCSPRDYQPRDHQMP